MSVLLSRGTCRYAHLVSFSFRVSFNCESIFCTLFATVKYDKKIF